LTANDQCFRVVGPEHRRHPRLLVGLTIMEALQRQLGQGR